MEIYIRLWSIRPYSCCYRNYHFTILHADRTTKRKLTLLLRGVRFDARDAKPKPAKILMLQSPAAEYNQPRRDGHHRADGLRHVGGLRLGKCRDYLSPLYTYSSSYFQSQSTGNTVDLGLVYIMQLNVLYLVIASTSVAISSAVNLHATNSWSNASNLTATNASTHTNSPLDFTAWTGPNCKQNQSNAHNNMLLTIP